MDKGDLALKQTNQKKGKNVLFERDPTSTRAFAALVQMWAKVYAWSGYCK